MSNTSRREFITTLAGATIFGAAALSSKRHVPATRYKLSLAEWSLHKALWSKEITNLDFPEIARKQFDIGVVEYVNQFFMDKAKDQNYLRDLMKRCKDNGVKNHLIMCDGEGNLGDTDAAKRKQVVENHYKWVDAASFLECITIRVNAFGVGSADEVQKAAAESLTMLDEYASKQHINVIVENHGGLTSDGNWLAGMIKMVNRPGVGLLPDFNNFCIRRDGGKQWEGKCVEEYDRYKGVEEMMPYAKGVSAKTMDFDEKGNCIETDYNKMFSIINRSGFSGYVGIEYEGDKLGEYEGIRKTKELLERLKVI